MRIEHSSNHNLPGVPQLLEIGDPQPWPATLCHLVGSIDVNLNLLPVT